VRHTSDDQVCITTVVAKGPGGPRQAEWQHQLISRAVLGSTLRTGAPTPAKGAPRYSYLVLSLLLLAGAAFFFYLALK